MCGIVYAQSLVKQPVNNLVLDLFDAQRLRGTDGFGLYDGDKGNIVKSTKEDKILKWLCKYDSSLIMFHHRLPTSTINTKRTAHPFTTKDYFGNTEYILVHNGNVKNADELRNKHEELGIKYQSATSKKDFNDSEALLWDFALYMEGKQKELEEYGDTAFICIKKVKGKLEKLYFARNWSRPLTMFRSKKGIALSSVGAELEVEQDTLYTYNYALNRLTKKKLNLPRLEKYIPSHDWGDSWQGRSYEDNWEDEGICWYDEDGREWVYRNGESYLAQDNLTAQEHTKLNEWLVNGKKDNTLTLDGHIYRNKQGIYVYEEPRKEPVVEYEPDTYTQELVPVIGTGVSDSDVTSEANTIKEILRDKHIQLMNPTKDSINELLLEYLIACAGEFETAYLAMEADYMNLMEADDSPANTKAVLRYEGAMEAIMQDEEYQAGKKKSSLYISLWGDSKKQQQLIKNDKNVRLA